MPCATSLSGVLGPLAICARLVESTVRMLATSCCPSGGPCARQVEEPMAAASRTAPNDARPSRRDSTNPREQEYSSRTSYLPPGGQGADCYSDRAVRSSDDRFRSRDAVCGTGLLRAPASRGKCGHSGSG